LRAQSRSEKRLTIAASQQLDEEPSMATTAPENAGTRSVARVVPAIETMEGEGFVVHRPFPVAGLDQIDPFLLLDEMGPRTLAPGEAKGAPDHPHRGFETVTYLLDGEMEHHDSAGHHGTLRPGDVQWMTAGAGVVHSEMPSLRIQREGGRLHGFQLWVNLPRDRKMVAPRYQELRAAEIPVVEVDGVVVRVVAGAVGDVVGAVETERPITYLHVTLAAGSSMHLPLDRALNTLVYVPVGAVRTGPAGTLVTTHHLAVLEHDADQVVLAADEASEVLVLAGEPLHEPIARYGPFVMNTRSEIIEAIDDYQAGRMGRIAPS
jgi:redox-sensitive bicupin YhaK (pirin superfamily)